MVPNQATEVNNRIDLLFYQWIVIFSKPPDQFPFRFCLSKIPSFFFLFLIQKNIVIFIVSNKNKIKLMAFCDILLLILVSQEQQRDKSYFWPFLNHLKTVIRAVSL